MDIFIQDEFANVIWHHGDVMSGKRFPRYWLFVRTDKQCGGFDVFSHSSINKLLNK